MVVQGLWGERVERDFHLDVRFFAPPDDLAPFFTTFYRLVVDIPDEAVVEDFLQPEWANLRYFAFNPPLATSHDGVILADTRFHASGPSAQPTHFVMGSTRMWGIGLLPLGWARYVGVPAHEQANVLLNGEASPVFAHFTELCDVLCDADGDDVFQYGALVNWFRSHGAMLRDEERILAVHNALVDPHLVQVGDLAERTGLNKRTLERVCQRHFGFAPSLLLRRQRMMRSLAAFMLTKESTWTESIDDQYHDQAHFVHEFQSFMGMAPGEYARMPHPILTAFMTERQRIWGSPVQTLDRPK